MTKSIPGFLCGLTLVFAPTAGAQAPSTPALSFEVATIKPGNSGERRKMFGIMPGGRFSATNATVKELITFAYDLKDQQLSGGPGWVNSDVYDIVAKPEGSANPDQIRLMMQALLADRFKLTLQRESKELSVYNLVIGKNGPKLIESKADTHGGDAAPRRMVRMGRGQIEGQQMSLPTLAGVLSKVAGRPVVDKTGLTGTFDMKLEWAPDGGETQIKGTAREGDGPAPSASSESSGPSLFTAIQEQLGLKLETQKGPVDVFVIARVEKPSEN